MKTVVLSVYNILIILFEKIFIRLRVEKLIAPVKVDFFAGFSWKTPFLTRELRACVRASCRYDVENGTRSIG